MIIINIIIIIIIIIIIDILVTEEYYEKSSRCKLRFDEKGHSRLFFCKRAQERIQQSVWFFTQSAFYYLWPWAK